MLLRANTRRPGVDWSVALLSGPPQVGSIQKRHTYGAVFVGRGASAGTSRRSSSIWELNCGVPRQPRGLPAVQHREEDEREENHERDRSFWSGEIIR